MPARARGAAATLPPVWWSPFEPLAFSSLWVALAMTGAAAAALIVGWTFIHRTSGQTWRAQLGGLLPPLAAGVAAAPVAALLSRGLAKGGTLASVSAAALLVAVVHAAVWWTGDGDLRRLVTSRRAHLGGEEDVP